MKKNESIKDRLAYLSRYLKEHPHLVNKIHQQLLISLHTKNFISINQIYNEALGSKAHKLMNSLDPNQGIAIRWDNKLRASIHSIVQKYSAMFFTTKEIENIVNLVRKREEAQTLDDITKLPGISFKVLAMRLKEYCSLPKSGIELTLPEITGLKVSLIKKFISDQLEFINIAKKFFNISDIKSIIDNSFGADEEIGKIGGKAAGMILAHRIITKEKEKFKMEISDDLLIPESYFIRSNVYEDFLKHNKLGYFRNQKYKSMEQVKNEYPMIKEIFKNAEFPPYIVIQLKRFLKRVGTHPLIVRSSSHLEDNFGSAFSGKYDSIFLANQGSFKERFNNLLGAIAEVYASTIGPNPILYRQEKNLIDYDEEMAVLIQKVVGFKYYDYFLPAFSGVGFSINEYRWSPKIKKEDGLLRMVVGLGTRAVERASTDYPAMISLSHPDLSPKIYYRDIKQYSQRFVDVINLKKNRIESISFTTLLKDENFPFLDKLVSVFKDGLVTPPFHKKFFSKPEELCITFFNLLNRTDFPEKMKLLLKTLETTYNSPVDVEFAFDGKNFFTTQKITSRVFYLNTKDSQSM